MSSFKKVWDCFASLAMTFVLLNCGGGVEGIEEEQENEKECVECAKDDAGEGEGEDEWHEWRMVIPGSYSESTNGINSGGGSVSIGNCLGWMADFYETCIIFDFDVALGAIALLPDTSLSLCEKNPNGGCYGTTATGQVYLDCDAFRKGNKNCNGRRECTQRDAYNYCVGYWENKYDACPEGIFEWCQSLPSQAHCQPEMDCGEGGVRMEFWSTNGISSDCRDLKCQAGETSCCGTSCCRNQDIYLKSN